MSPRCAHHDRECSSAGGALADARAGEKVAQRGPQGRGGRPVSARRSVERLGQEGQHHQRAYQDEDYGGLGFLRQVEAQAPRRRGPAPDCAPDDRHQQDYSQRLQVDGEYPHPGLGEQRGREGAPYGVAEDEDHVAQGEREEPPEDQEVREPGAVPKRREALEDLALAQHEGDRAQYSLRHAVRSIRGPSEHHQPEDSDVQQVARQQEGGCGEHIDAYPCGYAQEEMVRRGHGTRLRRSEPEV